MFNVPGNKVVVYEMVNGSVSVLITVISRKMLFIIGSFS